MRKPASCPFCDREMPMVRHHAETRRESNAVVQMCSDCERALHGLYSNREIRERLDLQTIDGLRGDARFMLAVAHVAKVPAGQFIRMRQRKARR